MTQISPVVLAFAGILLFTVGYFAGKKAEFGHKAWPLVFAIGWIASALCALAFDAPAIKLAAAAVACVSIPAFMRSMYLYIVSPISVGLIERSMSRRRK